MTTSILATILSLRKRRLDLQKQADSIEQEEKAYQEELINLMVSGELDEFRENDNVAYLNVTEEPSVDSWPDLLDYIRENDALDILRKRITPSAVKARWKDGLTLPGVDSITKRSLKFNI